MNFDNSIPPRNDSPGQGYSLDIPDEVPKLLQTICFDYIFPIITVFGVLANSINMWIYY
ncbi:hypothetical protein BgiBS90_000540, partial [Biomphalaria glabrata]